MNPNDLPRDLSLLTDTELRRAASELNEDDGKVRHAHAQRSTLHLRVQKEIANRAFRRALDPGTGRRVPIEWIGSTGKHH